MIGLDERNAELRHERLEKFALAGRDVLEDKLAAFGTAFVHASDWLAKSATVPIALGARALGLSATQVAAVLSTSTDSEEAPSVLIRPNLKSQVEEPTGAFLVSVEVVFLTSKEAVMHRPADVEGIAEALGQALHARSRLIAVERGAEAAEPGLQTTRLVIGLAHAWGPSSITDPGTPTV